MTAVFAIDRDGGVGHLQRGGEREQQHLQDNRHNQDGTGLRIAQQRLHFLYD
ncbi:hypothetical protein D3C73_1675340 [compost metagenome]